MGNRFYDLYYTAKAVVLVYFRLQYEIWSYQAEVYSKSFYTWASWVYDECYCRYRALR